MIRYLSSQDIHTLKPNWKDLIAMVQAALAIQSNEDYSQPFKSYLQYRNPSNRIIAMPAFIGGAFNAAGIKWIASFPENIQNNLPRAHSITLLNHAETGQPLALLSSNELSGLRTAAVSGYVIKKVLDHFPSKKRILGITGFGPIGQLHAEMVTQTFGDRIDEIRIFDLNKELFQQTNSNYHFVDSWEEAYCDADLFISCTTTKKRYIDQLPKPGSLQLNVSLRDFSPDIVMKSALIIVDDWNEVCRANTDIEQASLKFGLKQDQTISLMELEKGLNNFDEQSLSNGFISFHPMGMGIFDIALSQVIYEKAIKEDKGLLLPY